MGYWRITCQRRLPCTIFQSLPAFFLGESNSYMEKYIEVLKCQLQDFWQKWIVTGNRQTEIRKYHPRICFCSNQNSGQKWSQTLPLMARRLEQLREMASQDYVKGVKIRKSARISLCEKCLEGKISTQPYKYNVFTVMYADLCPWCLLEFSHFYWWLFKVLQCLLYKE